MPDNEVFARQIEQLKDELRLSQSQLALMFDIAALADEGRELSFFHSRCLELIAKHYDFVIGQMWTVNEAEEVMSCGSPWYGASGFAEFRQNSRERRLSKGVGLPGRAWGIEMAVWFEDIEKESGLSFPRRVAALNANLKSAISFPIKNGSRVQAVYEFFSTHVMSKNELNPKFFEKLGVVLGYHLTVKQALDTLAENELRNKIILDRAYNGFVAIDAMGMIITWTQRCEEIFGWTSDEVLGKPLSEIVIPERYRDAHIKGMFRFLSTGEMKVSNKRIQTPALNKKGQEIMIEMVIFPLEVHDKKLFGAYLVNLSQEKEPPAIVLQ